MKLSFKNILPILLIFTLLILFAGCFITPSEEQPGYTPPTYTVTYDGNTNTGGVVPTDANLYEQGVSVTVLGQGSLVKIGYTFDGWNTVADGGGTSQAAVDSFIMGTANVTLYAQWTASPGYTPPTPTPTPLAVTAAPVVKTVSVGDLAGGAIQATVAAAGRTYAVTTANIADGQAATITWYADAAKTDNGNTAPAGIAIAQAGPVATNALTLNVTVTETAPTVEGNYFFTATIDGVESAVKTLAVTAAPVVTSVTVAPATATVVRPGTQQLTATVVVVGGAAQTVTWTSSDTGAGAKVTVNATGLVTVAPGAQAGDYTITATSTVDATKSGTSVITVQKHQQ